MSNSGAGPWMDANSNDSMFYVYVLETLRRHVTVYEQSICFQLLVVIYVTPKPQNQ